MQARECIYEFVEEPKWKEKTSVFSVAKDPNTLGDNSPDTSGRDTPMTRARAPNFNSQHHFDFVSASVGKQLSPPLEPLDFDAQYTMLLDHFNASTSSDLILPQKFWTQDIIKIAFEVSSAHMFLMP